MAFRSHELKRVIYWKEIQTESMYEYQQGILHLQSIGWIVTVIVCDGRRGFFSAFGSIPVQMCQFHQSQIMRRYLTQHPKTEAGKELRIISLLLTKTDKESFVYWLEVWHEKHKNFLCEYTINPKNGWRQYTHRRLRSAYGSMKRNLPYLWTWYDMIHELSVPNTTNALDGSFSHLKEKISIHRWSTKERRLKMISSLLS